MTNSQNFGIAVAQLNLVVGDLAGNLDKIATAAGKARDELNCRMIVFPELTVTGYPPEDLLSRKDFIRDSELAMSELLTKTPDIALVVGHPARKNGKLFNAASVIDRGKVIGTYYKHHLPNYGVFDEKRFFSPGLKPLVVSLDDVKYGITICEDIWDDGPIEWAVEAGADLILNLNGSPYDMGKLRYRERVVVGERARKNGVAIIYANLVGGQDELVFDGGSFATDANGETVVRGPSFDESIFKVECRKNGCVEIISGPLLEIPDTVAGVYSAIRLGVRDYVNKNRFDGAVVAVSGGIDSALTLAIVADALGSERVEAVLMPSRHTQQMSIDDAKEQAEALGVRWTIVSIEPIYEAILSQLESEFANYDTDVTEENIQARCRGLIMMAISNKKGKIVITTGNKSEIAVGFATLYGDMVGGYAALKDVPKQLVYELAEYRNRVLGEVIPQRVFSRPPSAELADDQRDDDRLPPYEVLDPILKGYVEDEKSADSLVAEGFERETVERVIAMVRTNEYKRRQAAPGVRISTKAFGRDRRYPITNKY